MKKNIIFKFLFFPVFLIFPRIADTLKKHLEAREYEYLLKYLIKNCLKINVVYDVGAHKGRWTKWNKKILNKSEFILFEANEIHAKKLEKLKSRFFIQVLASEDKEVKFYRKGGTGDSLYLENTDHYDGRAELVLAKRLDTLINENKLPSADYIKLDVQGAELDILRGATDTLKHCSLVYMECPIIEYNIGSPKLNEYLIFMEQLGFRPLKIFEQHVHSGILIQIDIMFISTEAYNLISGVRSLPKFMKLM